MSNGVSIPSDLNYPTLGDIKDEVMTYLHDIDDPDRIITYINRTILELVRNRNFWFMHAVTEISTTTGTYLYNLPLDFLREIDFRIKDPRKHLTQISRNKLDSLEPNRIETTSPNFYCYSGCTDEGVRIVEFFPCNTGTVYLTYWRKPVWQTNEETRIIIPGEYTEVVVYGAVWRGEKARKDPDWKDTYAMYNGLKLDMYRSEEMSTDKDFVRQGRRRVDNLPPVVKLNPDIFPEYFI